MAKPEKKRTVGDALDGFLAWFQEFKPFNLTQPRPVGVVCLQNVASAAMSGHRRPLRGAQEHWQAAVASRSNGEGRFRVCHPERPRCKGFGLVGCHFGDHCTHLHTVDGVRDVREQSGSGGEVWGHVFLHKMEDRKVGRGSISLLLRTLATGGIYETEAPEAADLLLCNAFPSRRLLAKLREGCRVNHFPGEHELCCKDRMARLLRTQAFCPTTFILPEEQHLLEAQAEPEAVWILKPCQLGEGRHIEICKTPEIPRRHCTASRYISDPLLVAGRKVDLRVYVLLTAFQPLSAHVFREGLVRFCSGDYREAGYEQLSAHISNNAVQTKSQRHATGQNWSLEQLWRHLDAESEGPSSKEVWQRILRLVRDALTLWQPKAMKYMTPEVERVACLQLFWCTLPAQVCSREPNGEPSSALIRLRLQPLGL